MSCLTVTDVHLTSIAHLPNFACGSKPIHLDHICMLQHVSSCIVPRDLLCGFLLVVPRREFCDLWSTNHSGGSTVGGGAPGETLVGRNHGRRDLGTHRWRWWRPSGTAYGTRSTTELHYTNKQLDVSTTETGPSTFGRQRQHWQRTGKVDGC